MSALLLYSRGKATISSMVNIVLPPPRKTPNMYFDKTFCLKQLEPGAPKINLLVLPKTVKDILSSCKQPEREGKGHQCGDGHEGNGTLEINKRELKKKK